MKITLSELNKLIKSTIKEARQSQFSVSIHPDSPFGQVYFDFDNGGVINALGSSFAEAAIDAVNQLSEDEEFRFHIENESGILLDVESPNGDSESLWVYFSPQTNRFETDFEGSEQESFLRDYNSAEM